MRVDEHTIEVAGSPVFYRSASEIAGPNAEAAPPPLYLHGVPTSSDDWTAFLERTGGIAPDLTGFGRSGKGGHLDYSIDGLAGFVERFLAELVVPRVKLIGHDWGAAAGLVFAQRHPERVERLVLCNAVPLLEGFRWHLLARLWRRPVIGELVMGCTTRSLLARALRSGCVRDDAFSQQRLVAVWDQFDQGTQRAILRLYRSADERRLASEGAGLSALPASALVIWGERDPWLPWELAESYAAHLQNAGLKRIAEAGHWPWLDQPQVIDLVAEFLLERAPRRSSGTADGGGRAIG